MHRPTYKKKTSGGSSSAYPISEGVASCGASMSRASAHVNSAICVKIATCRAAHFAEVALADGSSPFRLIAQAADCSGAFPIRPRFAGRHKDASEMPPRGLFRMAVTMRIAKSCEHTVRMIERQMAQGLGRKERTATMQCQRHLQSLYTEPADCKSRPFVQGPRRQIKSLVHWASE